MYGDFVRTFGCPAESHPYSAGAFLSRPDAKQRHIAADVLVSLSSSFFYACGSPCILQAEQGSTQQPSAAIKSLYVAFRIYGLSRTSAALQVASQQRICILQRNRYSVHQHHCPASKWLCDLWHQLVSLHQHKLAIRQRKNKN